MEELWYSAQRHNTPFDKIILLDGSGRDWSVQATGFGSSDRINIVNDVGIHVPVIRQITSNALIPIIALSEDLQCI